MSWKTIAVMVALALFVSKGNAIIYSALRMCDAEVCDIDLTYYNKNYNLTIYLAYQRANPTMGFCIRPRVAQNGTNGTCYLNNYDKNYNCMLLQYATPPNLFLYNTDSSLNFINGTQTPASNSTYTVTTSSSTTSIVIPFLNNNTIYELVVGNSQNLATDSGTKLVYFHTFKAANTTVYTSTGIFMQRYYQCYQYYINADYNYNFIFYGGVVRAGIDVMYIHFLSFLSKDGTTVDTSTKLNIWGGLGFSTSHSSRDMVGFSSGYGYTYDLFSLYAAAPFNDTSLNINGTSDYIQCFTSNEKSVMPTFIAVGGYRAYDTLDTVSDEIIRKKINYKFCYGVAYSTSTTVPIQPTDQIKHSFVSCWIPNVTVWEQSIAARALLFVLIILALIS